MRIGTSSGCSDFWNRLGGQALVMIGRRYSRQPCSMFRIIKSEEKLGAGKMCVGIPTYRVCFLFIVVKVAIEDFYKQLHLRSGVHALVTDSNSFL